MSLLESTPPPIEPRDLIRLPYLERIKILTRHWVDYGAGLPKAIMFIYIAKVVFLYTVGGILVTTLTSGLAPLHPASWWSEPIVYQKLVLWTLLIEVLGIGGAWGPLTGHFKPMTGGVLYWTRPRTIRLPPWPGQVPFTAGDSRGPIDVALYLGLLASVGVALALGGVQDASVTNAIGANQGLVAPAAIVATIVLLIACGFRDKTIFLAARGEQWLPALVFFAFFPFVDMIVAAKILIVSVWLGAGISKLNRHFELVIPPMVSNTPWLPVKRIKRMHYANFPTDLRPSKGAKRLSHVGGAVGELIPPVILLFSHNQTLTAVTAVFMICYHVFITSTFPLAVPLEWNVMFMFITAFLFLGYPAHDGYALGNMDPGLLVLTVVGLLFFPVLGELRPDLVSFLPSLRQYSGNWATSMWALSPGAEEKLNEHIVKPAAMQKDQLSEMYDPDTADLNMHQYLSWRALHSQGRGLNSVMMNQLGSDLDVYDQREGELMCGAIMGWNFGDGHLHNQRLLEAVQRRCGFGPGELIVVWAESDPIGRGRQAYWVFDAAIGIVERGTWSVGDAVEQQPWLPDGPIPVEVEWRAENYRRLSHARPGTSRAPTGSTIGAA